MLKKVGWWATAGYCRRFGDRMLLKAGSWGMAGYCRRFGDRMLLKADQSWNLYCLSAGGRVEVGVELKDRCLCCLRMFVRSFERKTAHAIHLKGQRYFEQ